MATTALKTASVLAFERKLDPSDALFFAGQWDNRAGIGAEAWQPVTVREKSVRGTISNRLKTKDQDPAKLDAAIENPNLQTVDVATLPTGADTLKVGFTLRVLSGAGTPSACNNVDYQHKLLSTVSGYVSTNGFAELARRYAFNLANGRFLWRNRVGAEQVEVLIAHLVQGKPVKSWSFDALALSLRDFNASGAAATGLAELAQLLTDALAGKRHVLLEVTAFVRVGSAQEVFPSQELILSTRARAPRARRSTASAVSPQSTRKSSVTRCARSTPGTPASTPWGPSRSSPTVQSPPRARPIASPGTRPTSIRCSTTGSSRTRRRPPSNSIS